ncbi:MAG: methylmalonyl-CoA mutase family protein, partial [Paracoccaceae bacterium]
LKAGARLEILHIDQMGGAVSAIEYMKTQLVVSNSARIARIEAGQTTVVGVNKFQNGEESPLTSGDIGIMVVDSTVEQEQIDGLNSWRDTRDEAAVMVALEQLRADAKNGINIMPGSIVAAKAGVTTGEWATAMRDEFGEYRAPTGVSSAMSNSTKGLEDVQAEVGRVAADIGSPIRLLIGKPGLDGHSNGAEQIAIRARDCGMKVTYEGIRMTPEAIVEAAVIEKVHIVGLSILSGSHLPLIAEVMERMQAAGLDIPVIVGGIIPDEDCQELTKMGIARIYTPKDFDLNQIMLDIVALAA